MITFGIVGTGWRTEFFLRIAQACPETFTVAGIVGHTPAKTEALARRFGVKVYGSVEDLVHQAKPLFVVVSVTWAANPGLLAQLASLGMPVLSETPPAASIAEMDALCSLVRQGGAKIQVAEQYFLQPSHAARLAFVQSGRIGRVTQAQVSVAHGYHGVSLIRRLLGIGFENAKITASVFKSPLVKGPGRAGPPAAEEIVESEQIVAQLNFGDRLGVFDFTNNQYFAQIRDPRMLVRGERGEIVNDTAVYLQDFVTPIRVNFIRHTAGEQGNLEGHYLKGIQVGESWLYRNPVAPARLYDDEIAIATCLLKMADHARGGPDFYSLAEACQDRYLDIMISEAVKTQGVVQTTTQSWAH
jgi:predicted dehydrogenase